MKRDSTVYQFSFSYQAMIWQLPVNLIFVCPQTAFKTTNILFKKIKSPKMHLTTSLHIKILGRGEV